AGMDGLEGREYPFLMCSFWLVEQHAMTGRDAEATAIMEKLLSIRSPLGLLSEEYDPASRRLAGNFPQAFSHLALVRAAHALAYDDHGKTPRTST
nr:glycoside hydrolase family 15 protein [Actinomycetales bacterium]